MGDDVSKKEKRKKTNASRLGGSGLSLHAFANAKSTTAHYNPALIKKKREFYKNAKYVSKFKKKFNQQTQRNDTSIATTSDVAVNEIAESMVRRKDKKNEKKKKSCHLQKLYEEHREEREKARNEEEAFLRAKKEKKEKAEALRKAAREKMFKKTKRGQPVMKYRIEHLLQSIQNSK